MRSEDMLQPLKRTRGWLNGDHLAIRKLQERVERKRADIASGIDNQPVRRPKRVHVPKEDLPECRNIALFLEFKPARC